VGREPRPQYGIDRAIDKLGVQSGGSLQDRARYISRDVILGGPVETFDQAGRQQLIMLLREGLLPDSSVLDVGCGCLRAGYWLIHFLNPGRYHGIEPDKEKLSLALDHIIEPDVLDHRVPQFSYNDDFDFSVFNEEFDFVLARSIWVHAGKRQIGEMLNSFGRVASPDGRMLVSFLPAQQHARLQPRANTTRMLQGPQAGLRRVLQYHDYQGDQWSNHLVAHRRSWVFRQCSMRGLHVQETGHPVVGGQHWLRITCPF
jgi:ubiquinone/menaquinone biosynthesis C-methylase UbiE